MSKIYGYCRVSTAKQKLDRQVTNIKKQYPDAVIVKDAWTGTEMDRPAWNKLYKQLKIGDTIIFDEVSRLSREAEEGFQVYEELFSKGINLVFLKEPHINTDVYRTAGEKQLEVNLQSGSKPVDKFGNGMVDLVNQLLLDLAKEQIRLAFEQAEKEVQLLHQRISEGIVAAKMAGAQVGQKPGAKLITKKSIRAKEIIKQHSKDFGGSLSDAEVMKLIGCARGSYYKWKRELKLE